MIRKIKDSDGRVYDFSRFTTQGGAEIAVAIADESTDYQNSMEELRKFGTTSDRRQPEEANCDDAIMFARTGFVILRDGLNDFATGKIEDDLIKLLKATRKLEAKDSLIEGAIELFPKLIRKTKEKGIGLQHSLNQDMPSILEVLNQLVTHCETYINKRNSIGTRTLPTGETIPLSLQDLVVLNNQSSGRKNKKVSIERVNITDIRDMFIEVERTLHNIMGHRLQSTLGSIDMFLLSADELRKAPGSQTPQILDLSTMFREDVGVVKFIDKHWSTPNTPHFQSFKDGVKYINMLIEAIRDYSTKTHDIAYSTRAEEVLKQASTPSTSTDLVTRGEILDLVPVNTPSDKVREKLQVLASAKEARKTVQKQKQIPELEHTTSQIQKYLAE